MPSTSDPFDTVAAQSVLPGQNGDALVQALQADYTPEQTLGYDRARDLLFAYEMRTAGHLRDPYTGYELVLPAGLDPSKAAADLGVNTEHVWPQSKGARQEPLRSDMHHLYPVRDNVNSSRGNLPYGEVPDAQADAWYTLDASQSNTPGSNAERWSERGAGRWEPRHDAKGDVARAVFYVWAIYGPSTRASGGRAFWSEMQSTLLDWHRSDPTDAAEANRSSWIATQQGAPNPFILDPTLADRAFGRGASAPSTAAPGAPAANADLWISGLHYDNAGQDTGEGVGLSGLPGARLGGWQIVLYNGEREYETVRLDGSLRGDGTIYVGIDGIQNGPADGVALVDPAGRVTEFVSYEGAITAADGPASGRASVDIGVSEDGRDPAGTLLVRQSRAGSWRRGSR